MQAKTFNLPAQFGLALAFQCSSAMRRVNASGNYCPYSLFPEQMYIEQIHIMEPNPANSQLPK